MPGRACWTNAVAAFANSEWEAIAGSEIVIVTRAAGNIAIAGEQRIIKQQLAESGFFGFKIQEIRRPQRLGQFSGLQLTGHSEKRKTETEDKLMRTKLVAATLLTLIAYATPALGEIEQARDLMEAGRFDEAMKELRPAARSGNADAEELIGVMYAMGLGVERDDVRAFEWYLRASMKGHPGAQSGVGWYYEVGRGMPAPDLVRAYMWYVLSAIGGDPDAAISQEEVVKKMTPEQIEKAHILIDDYRVWLYPFR